MNDLELTGRARSHIIEIDAPRCALHYEVVTSFFAMRTAAAVDGIDLRAVSGFRDFDRQVTIWNRKWLGATIIRPLGHAPGPRGALRVRPGRRDPVLVGDPGRQPAPLGD